MAEAALIFQAASGIMSGIAGFQEARAQQQHAKINSYIARTRALQTDTTARQGLEDELGSMRAAMAGSSQRMGAGTMEIVNELRQVRGRERRIEVGNHRNEEADWRMRARNAGARAPWALAGGIARAGPSLFDLYQLRG